MMSKDNKFMKFYKSISAILYYIVATNFASGPVAVVAIAQSIHHIMEDGDMEAYMESCMDFIIQYSIFSTFLGALIIIPGMLYMMRDDFKRGYNWHEVKNIKYITPILVAITIAIGIFYSIGGNILLALSRIGNIFTGYEQTGELFASIPPVLQVIVLCITVPIAEELIFRGVVFRRIRKYINPVAGIWLSALAFAIFHGNVVQFVYTLPMGLLLALIYEKTRSVLWPIIIHIVANSASVFILDASWFISWLENGIALVVITVVSVAVVIASTIYLIKIKPVVEE